MLQSHSESQLLCENHLSHDLSRPFLKLLTMSGISVTCQDILIILAHLLLVHVWKQSPVLHSNSGLSISRTISPTNNAHEHNFTVKGPIHSKLNYAVYLCKKKTARKTELNVLWHSTGFPSRL